MFILWIRHWYLASDTARLGSTHHEASTRPLHGSDTLRLFRDKIWTTFWSWSPVQKLQDMQHTQWTYIPSDGPMFIPCMKTQSLTIISPTSDSWLMESGYAILADREWTCASWQGRKVWGWSPLSVFQGMRLIIPQCLSRYEADHTSVYSQQEKNGHTWATTGQEHLTAHNWCPIK